MNMQVRSVPNLHPRTDAPYWHIDAIVLISRGASIVDVCEVLNMSRSTFYRHLKRNPSFNTQVHRARHLIAIELFEMVRASPDWRASAWMLEKRFPKDYGTARERLRYAGCTCGASAKIMR
jgi:hypothetical protein